MAGPATGAVGLVASSTGLRIPPSALTHGRSHERGNRSAVRPVRAGRRHHRRRHGIGAAIATRLAGAGATVVVADIDEEAATRVADAVQADGGTAAAHRADAMSLSDGEDLIRFAESQFGRVDTLVNNAGVYSYVPLVDLTEAQWDRMIDVNMKGLMFQTQAFVRALRAAQRPGNVTNLASIGGFKPNIDFESYDASKGASSCSPGRWR
jgi:NAD(P)-dependent dehydrogenase (short-subunit alcohol dehydrogenase family)